MSSDTTSPVLISDDAVPLSPFVAYLLPGDRVEFFPVATATTQPPPLTTQERADLTYLKTRCWLVHDPQANGYVGWVLTYQITAKDALTTVNGSSRADVLALARRRVEQELAKRRMP